MKTSFKTTHKGSRYTSTWFKGLNKETIIVTTWIEIGLYGHNQLLFYRHSIAIKGFKKKNTEFIYTSNDHNDERYKEYITEHQLYESYHNHWNKINPIRLFSSGQYNSEIKIKDTVKQIDIDYNHKAY